MAPLCKLQRLKTRSQFQAVLAGTTVARTAHFALHCVKSLTPVHNYPASRPGATQQSAPLELTEVWIGAMVPKRWARRAVTRNTIKRQIYSISQDFESRLALAAHVVRLRAGFDRMRFPSATSEPLKAAVRLELQQLFAGAVRRLAEVPAQRVVS